MPEAMARMYMLSERSGELCLRALALGAWSASCGAPWRAAGSAQRQLLLCTKVDNLIVLGFMLSFPGTSQPRGHGYI
jgi:hypothetical protein